MLTTSTPGERAEDVLQIVLMFGALILGVMLLIGLWFGFGKVVEKIPDWLAGTLLIGGAGGLVLAYIFWSWEILVGSLAAMAIGWLADL